MTFGRSCMVPEHVLPACVNQHVAIVRANPNELCAAYLLGYLTHAEVKPYIESFNSGGSRRAITKAHIESFALPLPPIEEQRAIARILGTLDVKIELNRRMNRTLEALAQKLFKSWFVDFDPVIARSQKRRCAGLSDELAGLFPDAFEDSELGPIPKGWTVKPLRSYLEIERTLIEPQRHPTEEFDHYSIPAFDADKRPEREVGAAIKSGKYLVSDDVVLLSKLNPETPRVWWPTPDPIRRSIASTEFLVCHRRTGVSRTWLYWQLRDSDFMDEFASRVTGTSNSHQRVKPDDLLNLRRVMPDAKLREALAPKLDALTQRMDANLRHSGKLTTLRNLLLPKLLSGEIRVPVAEKAVEAAL